MDKGKSDEILQLQKRIGASLRKFREDHGLTQDDVASRAGITREALSLLENGKRLSLDTLIAVAKVFGLKVSYILSRFGY